MSLAGSHRAPAVWVHGLAVVIVALIVLTLHARRYYPFMTDDAFISLRYAARLLDGKGLTWTDGEWVEGYSNLLWVLGCAGLGALGLDLITAARVLGVACIGAVFVALVYAYRPRTLRDAPVSLGACLFLAFSGAIAVWSIGGLEQPLVAALLAWATVTALPLLDQETPAVRDVALPGLCFGLLAITRPDGGLFAATAAAVFLVVGRLRRAAWRNAVALLALPLLCIGAQLAFRLLYYGDWVPNTAYAKLAPSAGHARGGWIYLQMGTVALRGAFIPAVAGLGVCVAVPALRRRALFLIVPLVAWAAYVIVIGGDFFVGRRHFVPILVLSTCAFAEGFAWLVRQPSRRLTAAVWVFVTAALVVLAVDQRTDPKNLNAVRERYEWDGEVIARVLRHGFREQQPLLAVEAAGALPYFSKLPALDLYGLNDRYLAHHRPASIGEGRIGHELGDGQYALARQPDLMIFCWSKGSQTACSRSGKEMQADPRFAAAYVPVWFRGTDPYPFDALLFARRDSPRIGIRRDPTRVVVPAFLFSQGQLPVTLDANGNLGLLVPQVSAARWSGFALPEGAWRLRSPSQPTYRVTCWSHEDYHQFQPTDPLQGKLDIEIRALVPEAHVTELTFERVDDRSDATERNGRYS